MKTIANKLFHKLFFRKPAVKIDLISIAEVAQGIETNRILMAQSIIRQICKTGIVKSLHDVEFRAFSQWGEDGIIQYLIHNVPIKNKTFVEFGVETYREANTRFLVLNNNWKGLVIDGGAENIKAVIGDSIYWKHDLTAECHFITKENINAIISRAGFHGDIGLLSVDVDGNDYWIWEAIDCIQPRIVICEYNSVFGDEYPISVPYNENFVRTKAHYSNLYFGASLPALCFLADKKGYDFVGSNSHGVNAFFVRRDLNHGLPCLTAKEGYVESRFRESRDADGSLTYITGKDRLALIVQMNVVDVVSNRLCCLRDLVNTFDNQ